jgi:hypothetical protein
MILEAVTSKDLHIWHAFFGIAGSNNDLNVLNQSPLFFDALKGEAPQVQFSINGNWYSTCYYLADGIYPEWAAFMKTIPSSKKERGKMWNVLLGYCSPVFPLFVILRVYGSERVSLGSC